jgi:ribosomal-protein-alanine N-acetyltransferase
VSGEPVVRAVGVDDAAALSALHARSFPDWWTAETLAALLERAYVLALGVVVNPNGPLRGFILIQVIADEAEVLTFCVEPELRGRKLGAALLCAAADRSAVLGATRMFLEVSEGNPAARRLYGQQGFVEIGRRRAYYQEPGSSNAGLDALVMQKTLPDRPASAD